MNVSPEVEELSRQVLKLVLENGLKNMRLAIDNVSNGMLATMLSQEELDVVQPKPKRENVAFTVSTAPVVTVSNVQFTPKKPKPRHPNTGRVDASLANKVKAIRAANRWSQAEFAKRCGVNQEKISRFENCKGIAPENFKLIRDFVKGN